MKYIKETELDNLSRKHVCYEESWSHIGIDILMAGVHIGGISIPKQFILDVAKIIESNGEIKPGFCFTSEDDCSAVVP